MIDDKEAEEDYDLIKTLQDIRSTTLDSIENKKESCYNSIINLYFVTIINFIYSIFYSYFNRYKVD
jgi:hypothetical protein